ncbi:MAG: hypothetical protein NBV68_11660 [Erythrobacter sp.]|uniref:PAS domain-containing protein n=1 Tax=Erythrobacter sp. TaxID=1042 RepID=UPI0025E318B2|nr:hypothetical protein [Erythrobacter sp.]MCM0000031.1 hypothetical protein [Erythrobacter sp.]
MDTLRGTFGSDSSADRSWEESEDDGAEPARTRDLPPHAIGQDERRMQVRAYNHWASLLGESMFPSIEDLDPADLPDFGPHSVLLDFSFGIDNPAVRFLGEKLAAECNANGVVITRLSDVPPRSLLSRITDHYMQILANQAPIGFEAEFVNHAGVAILYRGILLPLSSNNETIDFIYGVINWKEMADQLTADELLLEIDQALELNSALELEDEVAEEPAPRIADPVTDWADSPAHEEESDVAAPEEADGGEDFASGFASLAPRAGVPGEDVALPDFSQYALDDPDEEYDEDEGEGEEAGYNFASLADYIEAPAKKAIDLTGLEPLPYTEEAPEPDYSFAPEPEAAFEPEPEPAPVFDDVEEVEEAAAAADEADDDNDAAAEDALAAFADDLPVDAGLYDCLAAARELARAADNTEDRSRSALYAAVSRAYDFSLAAQDAPEDYAELIADAGLTVQERAPMTPVVKLVFGHDYDKTRLTEYAAVLTHAHRMRLDRGSLAGYLAGTEGGVKAIVKAERRLRREEQGKPVIEDHAAVREALAQALRALEAISLEELDGGASEFALALIRRDEIGCAEILGEIPEDVAMIERAARKLVG